MSRYQWPRKRKNPDRSRQRQEWNVAGSGFVTEAAVLDARRARAMSATLRKLRTGAPGARAVPQGYQDLWVPIGPSVVLKGQAFNDPHVAGRVRDLAVSDDSKRAYAATANGGVWFTGDEGLTWAPLGNWLPTPGTPSTLVAQTALTCGCLYVKFGNNADADEVYVGTGELQPFQLGTPGARNGGVGVLRLKTPTTVAAGDPFGDHWEREGTEMVGLGIYRIVRVPGFVDDTMVAATSNGLWSRTGAFVKEAPWDRVDTGPLGFGVDAGITACDLLLMENSSPPRLVVAIYEGRTAVYYSENGIAGPFDEIRLPHLEKGRITLAHTGSTVDPDRLYVFGKGPKLYRVDFNAGSRPTVEEVINLPPEIFGKKDEDRSSYAMSIAVDPTDSRLVFLGGIAVQYGGWNAALFRAWITTNSDGDLDFGFQEKNLEQPGADLTYVGAGVHADVHRIRLIIVSGTLHGWVACDGGVFRSPDAIGLRSYVARNDGLAVLEGGYIASHPTHDQFVILGTQDNGVVQRAGDSVWLHTHALTGDGGGVAFHPMAPRFFAGQYIKATWKANDEIWESGVLLRRTFMPPVMRDKHEDSEKEESEASSFYSGIDVQAVGPPSTAARVAIGTTRVWISEDWDPLVPDTENSWKTLPSGEDPRARNPRNVRTDVPYAPNHAYGPVIATRWARDHRLFVLHERALFVFTPPASGTTSRWDRTALTAHVKTCPGFKDADISSPSSRFLPPLGEWSDLALDHNADGLTTCYVACAGHATLDGSGVIESTRMDTLWWYDGAGAWWPTGLRNDNVPGTSTGIAAPAFAIVVDPEAPTTVYVGTALGVWRGIRTATGPPKWAWAPLNNGLPEAAVQDLFLSLPRPGVKLLRAAVQARGAWELDLSPAPLPAQYLFLRCHPNDARRLAPAEPKDLTTPTLATVDVWPWYIGPDIRIVRTATGDTWGATGLTEADFMERHDAVGTPVTLHAGSPPETGNPNVNLVGSVGSYAGIYVLFDEAFQVHVLVHYRDVTALPAAAVTVTLLMTTLPGSVAEWETVPIDITLKEAITRLLTPTAPPTWDFSIGMVPADTGNFRRSPAEDIDARTPRVVTFDVDLTGLPPSLYLLLAVVSATVDPVSPATLAGTTLKDLVLNSHHVAMRVIQKA